MKRQWRGGVRGGEGVGVGQVEGGVEYRQLLQRHVSVPISTHATANAAVYARQVSGKG